MTGGQDAAGAMPVPELTRVARGRGRQADHRHDRRARQVPARRRAGRRASRSGIATGSTRRSACCATSPGVTVLIYDQRCAAEKRRLRKRGKLPDPAMRVVHQRGGVRGLRRLRREVELPVSVQPVETEFGRKTQIHQSSCNKDYSCLRGDCPSFLTVVPLGAPKKKERQGLHGRPRAARAGAAGAARRQRLHDGHRRHRRRHRQPDPRHRGPARRQARARPRSDRAQPEGRAGRLAPEDRSTSRGGRRTSRGRRRRLLPGLRRPGGDRAAEPRSRAAGPHDRGRLDQPGADRRDGDAHRRALPRRRRAARARSTASRARTRTSTSTRSAWPRRCSTTTWRPTCSCWAPPTRRAPSRSAPRPSSRRSSSTASRWR